MPIAFPSAGVPFILDASVPSRPAIACACIHGEVAAGSYKRRRIATSVSAAITSRRDKPEPYRAAEGVLKEILAASPENWAAAHNLAVLYSESMDRPAEATTFYSEFLSLAPAEHPSRAKARKWVEEHSSTTAETRPRASQ